LESKKREYKSILIIIFYRGGCGVVWLCQDSQGNQYALKQIAKKNKSESILANNNVGTMIARREIEILNCLNSKLLEYENPNQNYLITLVDSIDDHNDIWLIFEKGGKSLSSLTFKIKGEFLGNERIYSIKKGKFLCYLFEDINNLKNFIRKLLTFIKFLNLNGVVHCDMKPENILIDFDTNDENKLEMKKLKIIDFGSSFFINNPDNFSSNTPEYMSPEITDLIERNASSKEVTNFLKSLKQWPSCVDIWSLGVTILELILSCPLWMSYKAKVVIHGKTKYKTGLFGVKGRSGAKIYNKQIEVANSINKLMNDSLVNDESDKAELGDLLGKMLDLNYKTRITPEDALNHPFLKFYIEEKKNETELYVENKIDTSIVEN
jgi:serine/threonine protein kinase